MRLFGQDSCHHMLEPIPEYNLSRTFLHHGPHPAFPHYGLDSLSVLLLHTPLPSSLLQRFSSAPLLAASPLSTSAPPLVPCAPPHRHKVWSSFALSSVLLVVLVFRAAASFLLPVSTSALPVAWERTVVVGMGECAAVEKTRSVVTRGSVAEMAASSSSVSLRR